MFDNGVLVCIPSKDLNQEKITVTILKILSVPVIIYFLPLDLHCINNDNFDTCVAAFSFLTVPLNYSIDDKRLDMYRKLSLMKASRHSMDLHKERYLKI